MSEKNPFATIEKGAAPRSDGASHTSAARHSTAFAPIRPAALPSDEELRSCGHTSEVLAAGLPAWNLESPMAPVRRSRA